MRAMGTILIALLLTGCGRTVPYETWYDDIDELKDKIQTRDDIIASEKRKQKVAEITEGTRLYKMGDIVIHKLTNIPGIIVGYTDTNSLEVRHACKGEKGTTLCFDIWQEAEVLRQIACGATYSIPGTTTYTIPPEPGRIYTVPSRQPTPAPPIPIKPIPEKDIAPLN